MEATARLRPRPAAPRCRALRVLAGPALLAPGLCLASPVARLRASAAARPEFRFCRPEARTPVFPAAPAEATASVNAGDHMLYVGGGAINAAFRRALGLPEPNGFQRLHRGALAASRGQLARAPACAEIQALGLAACFARASGQSACFVDVLAEGRRSLGANNVAMLYVVGPRGPGAGGHGPVVAEAADFLKAVEETGENAIRAVAEYNGLVPIPDPRAEGDRSRMVLPRISVVQWCLVSGGVYKHPETSRLEVAAATVAGLVAGAAEACPADLPAVSFAHAGGIFREAVPAVLGA